VTRNCVDIATIKIGCLVSQKFLCLVAGTTIETPDTRIISNVTDLAEDLYGFDSNY